MSMHRVLLVAVLMSASLCVEANGRIDEGTPPVETVVDVSRSFADQHALILRELGDGKTYSEISPQDRESVAHALDRIAASLAGAGGIEGLSEGERVQLFNDQELVNSILTRARADSRLVCIREKKVGSHRHVNDCRTVADRRRERENSIEFVRGASRNRTEPN